MRDGYLGKLRTFSFVGLMVVSGGCDTRAVPPPVPLAASPVDAPRFEVPDARHQTDPARNRVWSLTHEGVFLQDRAAPEKIVKLHIPGWHWAGAPYGCLPDLALGPRGEAVVTSDVLPTLWRIDPETLAVSVHPLALDADTDKDVGFTSLTYSSRHGAYFAASGIHGSLWKIDPQLGRAQKIALAGPVSKTCALASGEGARFSFNN